MIQRLSISINQNIPPCIRANNLNYSIAPSKQTLSYAVGRHLLDSPIPAGLYNQAMFTILESSSYEYQLQTMLIMKFKLELCIQKTLNPLSIR